jgi:hypothetical protein
MKEGFYFKDVHVVPYRKEFTSAISINPIKKKGTDCPMAFGLFYGTELKGMSGIKFEGKCTRQGAKHQLFLCKMGAEIFDGDTQYRLMEGTGWTPVEPEEEVPFCTWN